MLAVGEHLFGHVEDRLLRMTTGLGGGVGGGHQEMCGALSAGILLIGALHGRIRPGEDESRCRDMALRYRERFGETFGATQCQAIRDSGYGSGGTTPCDVLVERAAQLLLEVLGEGG